MSDTEPRMFPIQLAYRRDKRGQVAESVYMRAYEVYCEVYGKQDALIDLEGRGCRGGFSIGELTAFLYAHSFPKTEWRARVDEAFKGIYVG